MKMRATLLMIVKVGLAAGALAGTGCAARPNKLMTDTPVLTYQAPDISEITGIEEPDESDEGEGSAAPAPEPTK